MICCRIDATVAASLPAGSTGAAVFVERVTASRMIRWVLLRQQATLNDMLPF